MKFFTSFEQLKAEGQVPCGYLREVQWNDWYKYSTKYELYIWDKSGTRHSLGVVKIGHNNMGRPEAPNTYVRPPLPNTFITLDVDFFSLGQDDNYYETMNKLPHNMKESVLVSLRDIAFLPDIINTVTNRDVLTDSILRDFTSMTVRTRLNLLAHDRNKLTEYHFRYESGSISNFEPYCLEFATTPKSIPPSNIHILIGRNGVGKTHCLRNIALCLSSYERTPARVHALDGGDTSQLFRRVILVSFSAFDPFVPIDDTSSDPDEPSALDRPRYYYIGLKSTKRNVDENDQGADVQGADVHADVQGADVHADVQKFEDRVSIESKEIAALFKMAVKDCSIGLRRNRWAKALEVLKSDPIFARSEIFELLEPESSMDDIQDISGAAEKIFNNLSSGHKLVLLIVTRLVALTTERTLVLLDEPEAHLHPPLTASLVRCLSQVLYDRNGVAIIATHSPVVLQEVPAFCVHKLRRAGRAISVERPKIETFAGELGILTDEIFEHEVTESGFYRLLKDVAERSSSYNDAVAVFDGKLSAHGKSILRMMSFGGRNQD